MAIAYSLADESFGNPRPPPAGDAKQGMTARATPWRRGLTLLFPIDDELERAIALSMEGLWH